MEASFDGIRTGPAGWSYADWKGIVYPGDARDVPGHPLKLLARYFDTVEVNATFYRPARPEHTAAWVEHVAEFPHFQFTVKLWEGYTHRRAAWPGREEERRFREGIAPLFETQRLGAVLVQFPWSFRRTPENRQWLARVLATFADYPLAVELRHASWDAPSLYAGLEERGVAFCNIDQPVIGESLEPSERVTAPFGYVRFHGRNYEAWFSDSGRDQRYDYLYNEGELAPWIEKIRRMKKRVNGLFIVTNNHYRGQAVVNAIEIEAALGRTLPPLPPQLVAAYPHLRGGITGDLGKAQ